MDTETKEEPVPVVFRRWRDTKDVLALFPTLAEHDGLCLSYMRVGQHSAADYAHCICATRPAHLTEPDTAALKRELEGIGYTLSVYRRRPT